MKNAPLLEISSDSSRMRIEINPQAKLQALLEITRSLSRSLSIEDVLPMASTIPAACLGASTAGRVVAEWDAAAAALTVVSVDGA